MDGREWLGLPTGDGKQTHTSLSILSPLSSLSSHLDRVQEGNSGRIIDDALAKYQVKQRGRALRLQDLDMKKEGEKGEGVVVVLLPVLVLLPFSSFSSLPLPSHTQHSTCSTATESDAAKMAPNARQSARVSRRGAPGPPPPLPTTPAAAASPAAITPKDAYVPPTPMAEMVARLAKKGRWRTARPACRMIGGSRNTKKVEALKVMSRSASAGGSRRAARATSRAAPRARPAVAATMPSPTYRDRAAMEWPTDSQRTMARAIMPEDKGRGGGGGGERVEQLQRERERATKKPLVSFSCPLSLSLSSPLLSSKHTHP